MGVPTASACGDALGAGYEFQSHPLPSDHSIEMKGGNGFAAGEWTDDSSQLVAIGQAAAKGLDLTSNDVALLLQEHGGRAPSSIHYDAVISDVLRVARAEAPADFDFGMAASRATANDPEGSRLSRSTYFSGDKLHPSSSWNEHKFRRGR